MASGHGRLTPPPRSTTRRSIAVSSLLLVVSLLRRSRRILLSPCFARRVKPPQGRFWVAEYTTDTNDIWLPPRDTLPPFDEQLAVCLTRTERRYKNRCGRGSVWIRRSFRSNAI